MKFLFFNLMAVIAILYLVAVEDKSIPTLPEMFSAIRSDDVGERAQNLVKRAQEKLSKFKLNSDDEPTVEVLQKDEKKISDIPASKPQSLTDSDPVEVAVRSVHPVPQDGVQKEISAPSETPESKISMKPTPQKFMSRTERRRELNRLAHDMEMMFADKMAK